ncbi:MAG: head morphogenesis protein [Methylotenera sp.]|nr:head morphogenesis protein [Methylotenera sp.]
MAIDAAFNRPFQEQVDFFRQKINLPSERWDDVFKSAHDRAFIIAGATKADLLDSFRSAVDQAIEQGKSLKWFQNEFDRIVDQHGWIGWTGEGSKKGRDWRSKIIYQTNMSTSYAAGRQKQLNDPDLLKMRPYRTYVHADGVRHPRLMHQSWNGITLPADDVFWDSHTAPNGWFCHCRIESASARDYRAAQAQGKAIKPDGWDKVDPKTGEYIGIDKGFGYAPGGNVNTPLRSFIQDKLIKYPPAIAKALSRELNRKIAVSTPADIFALNALSNKSTIEPLWLGFFEKYEDIKQKLDLNLLGYLILLPADSVRHIEYSHGSDGGNQRPALPKDFTLIYEILNNYDDVRLGDISRHNQPTLVFTKLVENETYRLVFQVLNGKRNKSLQLISMVIKLIKK